MPPFVYQPYSNRPYANTISELMLRQGDVQAQGLTNAANAIAQGQRGAGQAWGQGIEQLGQNVGSIPATMQRSQLLGLQTQDVAAQIKERNAIAVQRDASAKGLSAVDTIMAHSMKTDPDTGVMSFDRPTFEQGLAKSGQGHLYPQYAEMLDKLDASAAKRNAEARVMLAQTLYGIDQAGYTPQSVLSGAAYLKANGVATNDHLAPILGAALTNPDPTAIKAQIQPIAQALPEYRTLVEGEQTRKAGLAKTEAETAKASAEAAKATAETVSPKGTAEQDDQRYRNIVANGLLGKTITPEDQAWASAYKQQKTLAVDTSASAASDRQTKAILASAATQQRAQDFNVAQAARKELVEKVETPYQTSLASSNTLRDVVDAAKHGNKVAGSLQSLETTMAAIRAQGLNRINTAAIGVTANAGNMFDRIAGWFGKATVGEPVPANIQKDMLEFADILDKAAYRKYSSSFDSIANFYNLTKEQRQIKSPPPNVTPPTAVGLTPGLERVKSRG